MTTVLFVCPHGAAKSVIAAKRFERAATEAGFDISIDFAGPDPDAEIGEPVRDMLTRLGHTVDERPRLVTSEDIVTADVVVTLGCDLAALPAAPKVHVDWSHVPMPSQGVEHSRATVDESIPSLLAMMRRG